MRYHIQQLVENDWITVFRTNSLAQARMIYEDDMGWPCRLIDSETLEVLKENADPHP